MAVTLKNFSPSGSYVTPAFSIEFDIVSDGNPIDLAALSVQWLDTGDFAINNGVIQDAYEGSIVATTVDGDAGYHITIIPPRHHFGVDGMFVEITGDTDPASGIFTIQSTPFSTTNLLGRFPPITLLQPVTAIASTAQDAPGLSFSSIDNVVLYQLNDASEPVITSRVPPSGQTGVLRATTTSISFALHDRGQEGVDLGTVDVYIEGEQAIGSGFFIAPYTGSLAAGIIDGFAGFSFTINIPELFDYSEVVEVRVVASDLVEDPSAVNTLDITYSFTIEPYVDVIGPSPAPTQPPDGLALDACIEFDWLDEPFGEGPDFFTLNVTLIRELTVDCITGVNTDIAVVNGIATAGYEVFAEAITVDKQKGFHVIVCPKVPFKELETITVIINGSDTLGNSNSGSFNISTIEVNPPVILNLNPAADATDVDPLTSIVFEMHDTGGTGVDVNALDVFVDGQDAILDGVFQPGYSGSIVEDVIIDEFTLQFDGYVITINKDIPYAPGATGNVEIDGYDAYGSVTNLKYSFSVAPDIVPPSFAFSPTNGFVGANRDTDIVVDVIDKIGLNTDTVNITIDGEQAVLNGVGVGAFSTVVSEIITTPGLVDGYRYTIDPDNDFTFNESIVIGANAQDQAGNLGSGTVTFTTFSDTTAPIISGITPVDGQLEVLLDTNINVTIRDAYDVDLTKTNIKIGGNNAMKNGVTQAGFAIVTNRVLGAGPGIDPGDGYSITINPDIDFDYNSSATVAISTADQSQGNTASASVTWSTVSPLPPVFSITPSNEDTGVAVDTNFTFTVETDGYGVDPASINFTIDSNSAVSNGVVEGTSYLGAINTVVLNEEYSGFINPRFLLTGSTTHKAKITAAEPLSGNKSSFDVTFTTESDPANPKTLYVGTPNGVRSIQVAGLSSDSTLGLGSELDGYAVNDIDTAVLNQINRLAIATNTRGAILYSTNYFWPTLDYSAGDEIVKVALTQNNNGTIYLANRTKDRVEVYYNILFDDFGRAEPDAYYDANDIALPGLLDGYVVDMVVTSGTSTVKSGSNSIFVGTPNGAFRIETDESSPGTSESGGTIISYGNAGSGYDYEIIEGTTNEVVAIDVNITTNHLYVATRNDDVNDINALTYIDLATNTRSSFIPEERLINRLMNDITFKNR